MRVVAGTYRGRRLKAPRGSRTRPTADRVREALFSVLGDLGGEAVLDLYAGSGALGIEALLCGAGSAVLVERDPRAVAAIEANLAALGAEAEVRRQDALRYLEGHRGPPFALVFADSPYDSAPGLAGPLTELLQRVTTREARIVTESDRHRPLELDLPLLRERTYGDTRIAVHARA